MTYERLNLIQALNKLREDIQYWVTLNIRNILSKLNQHTSNAAIHMTQEDRDKVNSIGVLVAIEDPETGIIHLNWTGADAPAPILSYGGQVEVK